MVNEQAGEFTRELPEGTVTFLFTDIEGSTKLLRKLGEQYVTLLADHHRILRETVTRWNGREVSTEGDAFFVSFPRATEAVEAAIESQRALAEHVWPQGVTVRVRMGLHTGEPWTAEDDYVGMDVHRAARIAHVGHGGQVLLSATTTELVIDELPDGVSLLDLGRHRLKDIARPEHIRQLVIRGLPSEFPSLKSIEALGPEITIKEPVRLPDFLGEQIVDEPEPVFVGRELEIERLFNRLDISTEGQGGVFFIAGDAGSGKTALLDAFSRKAQERIPDRLVARGACSAFTGSGDPYAPFRTVLRQLTGDVETAWKGGLVSQEGARRLWSSIPLTAKALIKCGPNLIDTFIPGPAFLERVSNAAPADGILLEQVKELVDGDRVSPGSLEQQGFFEEVRDVLVEVSDEQPILLLLDDMQWADTGSINLLFHLSREILGSRILLVCAYRPEVIAVGRRGSQHPFEPVLNELRRTHGDIWIDLNKIQSERFVDEFIDSEPNRLGSEFRKRLARHTGGHALFTVELLRDLQERADLIKDNDGYWIEEPELAWSELPARIEGVIEARIGRLEEELRDVLTIAAVEGEDFTAQVIARVEQLQERRVLRLLSRELEKQHQLVKELQHLRVGPNLIFRYRFAHSLFQKYLYTEIGEGERRVLHGEIGDILADLYGDQQEEIAVQLGMHYSEAGKGEKAIPFLIKAGDDARAQFAFREACDHYQHALSFQREDGLHEQIAKTLMKLGLTHNLAKEFKESRIAYEEGFVIWKQLSIKTLPEKLPLAPHPGRISDGPVGFMHTRDPATTGWGSDLISNIFSGLVEITSTWSIVPDVAESWVIENDGALYVFQLRKDVFWSDGSPVIARDFEYAWKRILNPKTKSPVATLFHDIEGAKAYNLGHVSDPDRVRIVVTDDYTLKVKLRTPTGYFLQILANNAAFPVPRHIVDTHGDTWTKAENLVTNGPFMLEEEANESLTLLRNPSYHGRFKGNGERVVLYYGLSKDDEYSLYLNDEIDGIRLTNIPLTEREKARSRFIEDYLAIPEPSVWYVYLNPLLRPFEQLEVRLAFAYAMNKDDIIASFEDGSSPALGGLIPPGIPGHDPAIGLDFDPDKARQLLGEAGYSAGKGLSELILATVDPLTEQATVLAAAVSEILGVKILVNSVDHDQWIGEIEGAHIALLGWSADYPDPDNFLRVCIAPIMHTWKNESFTELVESARQITDQNHRLSLYQEADRLLIKDAVIIPLSYRRSEVLIKPWVKNKITWPFRDVILIPH